MTRAERIAREKIMRFMYEQSLKDTDLSLALRESVPLAWHTLEHDLDITEAKVQVTLRLDESVAKFYRAMGRGYQARINRILALWANMKIAELLRAEEAVIAQLRMMTSEAEHTPAQESPK
jgi:uncharacterized protein (DUF4415 family)